MRIAITGGTGFVGRHLARRFEDAGLEVLLLSRRTGFDLTTPDRAALAQSLHGCDAVVHCAGINREIGQQTYDAVHIRGTEALVAAAATARVGHVSVLSFLRARPDGPTAYHRSKWVAEAIVRESGIPFTVVKAGVIYGQRDHLLDHVSHALHTFPVFGLVGRQDTRLAPVAVDDVTRILAAASTGDPRLENQTIAVIGPERLTLREVVERVARAANRPVRFVRLPVRAHLVLGRIAEALMRVPLISIAQVHILAEGVIDPSPPAPLPPLALRPTTPFSEVAIRAGLPEPGAFTCRDLRWSRA